MEFRILGPIGLSVYGQEIDTGATKVRGLLGILLFKANSWVAVESIADLLWDDDRPPDPAKTLQTYVSRLRRVLKDVDGPVDLPSQHRSYRLSVDPSTVDYHRFLALVRQGHSARSRGDHGPAVEFLETAVGLWSGVPFTELKTAAARRMQDTSVRHDLLPAYYVLFDAKLAIIEPEFVLDRLPSLLAEHNHDERLARQLMQALYAANRAGEIPTFYRAFARRLADDLDAEPGAELVHAYEKLTHNPAGPQQMGERLLPPELSRDTPYFSGRARLLNLLDTALLGDPDPTATVVAIDGAPGVGKTALVTHWARRRHARFSGGVLFANLHGYASSSPVEPASAMATLLDQLGIPLSHIPATADDRAALLRHSLTGRHALIILDNARDSSRIRPLLAATAACPVLITSRQALTSLAYHDGITRITVPPLGRIEARALLDRRIGPRASAEPAAVTELAALCGQLPLALRIVSEHIVDRPAVPLHELASGLRARRLLDAGGHSEGRNTTLRAVFSWSSQALQPEPARLFRLLGLHPGNRFSTAAIAALSGRPIGSLHESLDALVDARLLEQERIERYHVHDLLHLYAADIVHHDEDRQQRTDATARMLDWYLESVRAARNCLASDGHEVPPLEGLDHQSSLTFDTSEEALRWFVLERTNLVAVTRTAAGNGYHEHVWRFAACLNEVLNRFGGLHEQVDIQRLGRISAAHVGRRQAEAGCLNNMGAAFGFLQDYEEARRCTEQALTIFRETKDQYGEAAGLHNMGSAHLELGDPHGAIEWYERSLALFTRLGNEWAVASCHSRLGDAYRKLDRYLESDTNYHISLAISKKLKDLRSEGATLTRLGQLHEDLGEPDLAVTYCQAALEAHRKSLDRNGTAATLGVLASAYLQQRSYDDAIAHAKESVATQADLNNLAGQAHAMEILGRAYQSTGDHANAYDAWSKAAIILEMLNNPRHIELANRLATLRPRAAVPDPRSPSAPPGPSQPIDPRQRQQTAEDVPWST